MRAPRRTVHRGSVEAEGAFLAPGRGGEASLRERALSLWSPGVAVHRVDGGLCVLFGAPRRVRTRASPGAPLVRSGQVLLSAPLAPDELEAVRAPPGAVVLVRAGHARAHLLNETTREDPARWLDLAAFQLCRVETLGAAAPAGVRDTLPPPEVVPLRERLAASVPAAAAGSAEALEALGTALRAEGEVPVLDRARGLRAALARMAARIARWLSGGRGRSRAGGARSAAPGQAARYGPSSQAAAAEAEQAPPPAWRSRLGDWLNRAAVRLALASGLARILGARQAEYFSRMMRFFEDGDLEQALRHAIPIDPGAQERPARAALGVPEPREELKISLGPPSSAGVIGVGGGLLEELRRLYRDAFQRLVRQGQIERAAFVLAELLGENEEAVAFLERHGMLRLAAEVAEARGLPPGLQVRQWFVAGDVARALLVARRTGAFADALHRLKASRPEQARAFALLWADALAEAGDYWRAADVAWEVPEARRLALRWLERAIEAGGPTGARALARTLAQDEGAFQRLRPRALELFDAPFHEAGAARRAFADELLALGGQLHARAAPREPSPGGPVEVVRFPGRAARPVRGTRGGRSGPRPAPAPAGQRTLPGSLAVLARPLVRALVRDHGEGGGLAGRRELEVLARLSGEVLLEADLPPLAPVPGGGSAPLTHRAGAPGQRRIFDVALLPGGRLLLAYGEAGAEVCTPDGRRVHGYDVPAHSVVVSDHGDRAIAVAPRGEQKTLSRLDLLSGRAERWCEAPLRAFAHDYDGDVWLASESDALLALDARSKELRAVWRLPRLPGGVLSLARSREQCCFVVADEGSIQLWKLELPGYTLRARAAVSLQDDAITFLAVAADGMVACVEHYASESDDAQAGPFIQRLRVLGAGTPRGVELGVASSTWPPVAAPNRAAAFAAVPDGLRVRLVETSRPSVSATLELPGARSGAVRFSGELAAVADDQGRALVVDLGRSVLVREIRR
jgi:hypothetical protein